MRVGVVVNANALGVRRRPGLVDCARELVGQRGEVVETHSPDELDDVARGFAERGVELVGICGGDGTNLAVLTALVGAYRRGGLPRLPLVALLRGGTVNTVAQNLGISGAPDELLARLVRDLDERTLRTRPQDLLEVNGRFGFLFAAAMGARFLEAYYDTPRPGPMWAGLLAARTVGSSLVTGPFARKLFAPLAVELEVDGAPVPIGPLRLFICSTVPDVGIGMRVAWQAGTVPGRFHLVASRLSTVAMALQLPSVLTGRRLRSWRRDRHLDRLATRVQARFAEPEVYTFDGELYRERELDIRIGPRLDIVIA